MTQPTPPVDPASPLGWLNELVHPSPPAPLQASDPAHLANGMVVPRSEPPAVGGGSYTVDLEHAPAAIRDLKAAKDELVSLKSRALELGKVVPPALDPVSADAASALGTVAVGGTGSLLAALDAGIAQLETLIHAIESELRDYQAAEATNTRRLDVGRS